LHKASPLRLEDQVNPVIAQSLREGWATRCGTPAGEKIVKVRKLIVWNLVTLDGYFEGAKSWEIDWHEEVWGEELEQLSLEQSRSAGMLLFGRVTYQGMADYWSSQNGEIADFMNSIPKIVFSRTLERAEWNNTRLVKENAAEGSRPTEAAVRQGLVHLRQRESFLHTHAA
jgi:hypothetical protein